MSVDLGAALGPLVDMLKRAKTGNITAEEHAFLRFADDRAEADEASWRKPLEFPEKTKAQFDRVARARRRRADDTPDRGRTAQGVECVVEPMA